jgi:excisionase family DNA binding protein
MKIPKEIVTATIALTDQYFDLQGLSTYSSIPISTLRDYLRKQNLPHFKTGGKILVKRSEFDAWIETHRVNRVQDLKELTNSIMKDLTLHRIHH